MTHPREFKVIRQEPGIDWRPWDLSYHSTEAGALKAAEAFLKGEGKHYTLSPSAPGHNRQAIVARRRNATRYTPWDRVARLVKVQGRIVKFLPGVG